MGVALLAIGLVMNVVGVALSSSRDLGSLVRALASMVAARLHRMRMWARRMALKLRRQTVDVEVQPVSGSAGVSVGASGTVFAWNPAPDGMDLETAIQRFRDRTDNLHGMIGFEAGRRKEENQRLSSRLEQIATELTVAVTDLEARVDEFDVKPAGQRALGALLVICGTVLMFVGGLLG